MQLESNPLMPLTPAWTHLGRVAGIEQTERGIVLDCGGPQIAITFVTPTMLRVRVAPSGGFVARRSWAVAQDDSEWPSVPFEVREADDVIEVLTEQIRVRVERDGARLACFDHAGRPWAQDATPNIGWRRGAIAGWKQIEPDEHFYGFGERTGLLDKRSERVTNWTVDAISYGSVTDNMYQAIPFFMALRPGIAYGVFFNTTYWSQFDLGAEQPGVWQMESRGPELDYYLIYGPRPAQILETYTALTGRMPLPPRWALGYHQCRWSYRSAGEIRELASEFRSRRIPCDVIHLDIDYMRGFRVFTWSPTRFSDPAGLVQELRDTGFRTVTIIDPGVKYETEAEYAVFDDGVANNYFVRNADGSLFHGYVWPDKSVFPDFLRPDVRAWWAEQHRALTDVGVAGIWNDMNEPAISDRPFGDDGKMITFPLDAPQGPEAERTDHAETHNLYGLHMARAAKEAMDLLRPDERSFVLTRSGFAGIQRWSAVWMGDNQSQWDHLDASLPTLCNMGLSGVPFVGSDIGGFAGNATAEMFARWMQVGVLYPFMRGHSAAGTAQHEPWIFGDETERICREYIELRYRLLPYMYTLFWQATQTGAPVLRPLVYEFPDDVQTYTLYDQVLLGPSLMAAPVYRPGVTHRAVYLPQGTWFDWWTGERFKGASPILAHAPLNRMPLYVRAGAIIPMQPVVQHTGEMTDKTTSPLRLRVWSGEGSFTFYEDDGTSLAYRDAGTFATIAISVQQDGQQLVVELGARAGAWMPPAREIVVEVVGVGEQQFGDDGTARRLVF